MRPGPLAQATTFRAFGAESWRLIHQQIWIY